MLIQSNMSQKLISKSQSGTVLEAKNTLKMYVKYHNCALDRNPHSVTPDQKHYRLEACQKCQQLYRQRCHSLSFHRPRCMLKFGNHYSKERMDILVKFSTLLSYFSLACMLGPSHALPCNLGIILELHTLLPRCVQPTPYFLRIFFPKLSYQ